ncbi:hypothetical protein A2165_01505 [Candidatus Curtissbacteria bacterium RBG_13_40_7]|uniref:Uncharacterized protein n=1 Tax=Candidatus Curtissbacteria bacterium RBG_13_40_7 TaxID=1797706 RepID=A0A1F5FW88_9BACT|nr:MAG: hypothetical protein A2165_01505 [Candidatus Curtissbacteria bacterium RBG_13_40_7]
MKLEDGNTPLGAIVNTANADMLSALKDERFRRFIAGWVLPSKQKEVVLANGAGVTYVDWSTQEIMEALGIKQRS